MIIRKRLNLPAHNGHGTLFLRAAPRNAKRTKLTHHAVVFWRNLVKNAHFARLPERIDGLAEIFLRKLVDVFIGAAFGNLDDAAANLEIAVRILRVLNREGDARVAAHILVLHAAEGGIEYDVLAVEVHPYGSYLWTAIGHNRGQIRECRLLQQVRVFLRDVFGHGNLLGTVPASTVTEFRAAPGTAEWLFCRRQDVICYLANLGYPAWRERYRDARQGTATGRAGCAFASGGVQPSRSDCFAGAAGSADGRSAGLLRAVARGVRAPRRKIGCR